MKLTSTVMILGLVVVFSGFPLGLGEKEATDSSASPSASQDEMAGDNIDGDTAAGGLISYTTLEDARTRAETAPAVLFFNAGWCPTCREAVADIASRQEELGDITVFLVDYDGERELKKRYGVTIQHTYVQIDASGEAVTLWNGGGVDMILMNLMRIERG